MLQTRTTWPDGLSIRNIPPSLATSAFVEHRLQQQQVMWDDERALPLLLSHDSYVSSVDTVDVLDHRGMLDQGLCKRDQFVGSCRYAFQITGSSGLKAVYRFEAS